MNLIESAKKVANNLKNYSFELAGTDIEAALLVAEKYGKFLWFNHVGILADSEFEIKLAEYFAGLLKGKVIQGVGDTLHLMTAGYASGGHTRVVERFLKGGAGDGLATLDTLPKEVLNQIPKHVKVFNGIRKQTGVATISEILGVGLNFKKVILHIHPDDIFSAIAAILLEKLGVKVFMYNHADHAFSFGYGAAEKIFEISKCGWIQGHKRGIEHKQSFIGIPIPSFDLRQCNTEKNKSIHIFMAGSAAKFTPWGKFSVPEFINQIHKNGLDQAGVKFTICGPNGHEKFWHSLDKNVRQNVEFLGVQQHTEYMRLLSISDCYVDSFPQANGTGFAESVMRGIPSFGLDLMAGYSYADVLRSHSMVDLVNDLANHIENRNALCDSLLEVRGKIIREQSIKSCVDRLLVSMEERQSIPLPNELMSMKCMPDFYERFWESEGVIYIDFELLSKLSAKQKPNLFKCWVDALPYAYNSLEELVELIVARDARINALYASPSWRLTRPLRFFARLMVKWKRELGKTDK